MKTKILAAIAIASIIALTATLILAHSPTQAQNAQDSEDLAKFAAVMQYIRSTPTPADVKANNIPVLDTLLDPKFSDIYITGFITPYTGETPDQVKARLQSISEEEDRFTAVMVESYRLASDPFLLDIIHQLLPLYYVQYFTTAEDLNASDEFLKSAKITTLADAFDRADYTIPAQSATGTTPPSTRGPGNVDSDDLAKFAAVMQYIRSTPTPADVKANNIPVLDTLLDPKFSDIYITGFITPYTGETPDQVKARLQSISEEEDRFTAVMVESYRLASDPFLLDIIHQLLPLYYVQYFTTAEDLNASDEFLKSAKIATLAAAFDPTDYDIPAPSTTEPSDTGSPATDRAALTTLYNATDGPNWENNTNWDTNEPLGEWHGVTTDDNGRVTHLSLRGSQMSGEIPPELGNLTKLEYLSLTRNQLTGSIPPQLGKLANLEYMSLSGNQLTGAIPSELGKLSNLTRLYLWGNDLSGEIPPELGNLANLESLYLAHNQLSGCIPNTLGNTLFNDFSELDLSFCSHRASHSSDKAILEVFYKATGGANWSTSTNWLTDKPTGLWYGVATDSDGRVTSLYLGRNQLSGSIPAELGNLTKLEFMALDRNKLSGPIPPELGNLTKLERLYLYNNELSGSIPTELGNLSKLDGLALSGNQLSGSIPSQLGNLTKLEALALQYNQLSGALPQNLILITGLEVFHFGDNNGLCSPTDATFVDWLQAIPTWSGPDCEQVKAIASDRAALVALYNATDGPNWSTSTNWLSDKPLGEWHGVTTDSAGRVTRLSLGRNHLSGPIPTELGNLTELERLYLWGNQLSGNIPSELGNLANLKSLSLDSNQLSGGIPSELGDLTKLESLSLWGNQLTGALPQTLTSITGLETFYFSHNDSLCAPTDTSFQTWLQAIPNWSGPDCDQVKAIASDRAALVALDNATDGPNWSTTTNWGSDKPLGQWYGVTTNSAGRVTSLNLRNNQLSGSIPPELGNLTKLTYLALHNNQLSGGIPAELGNLTDLRTLSLWDNQLSGGIPTQLGNLTNLERLYLNNNQLSGSIPSQLSNLSNLESLNLGNNKLSGPIPSRLENLSNLESLYLNDNQLNGSIPLELGSLTKLQRVALYKNQLSGPIPSQLGNLTKLTYLALNDNQLSGGIPVELGNLTNLQRLYLNDNQLNGSIPSQLGDLTNLRRLYLHRNQLTGDIPPELDNLTNLERLYLKGNDGLTGCVPAALRDVSENDFAALGLPFCP